MPRHPHLLLPDNATAARFTSANSPRANFATPPRNRLQHGNALLQQLNQASATPRTNITRADGNGFYETPALLLNFESDPDFPLNFESLDLQGSGIQLLNVTTDAQRRTLATVRVPYDKVGLFIRRLEKYRDADPNAPIPPGRVRRPLDYRKLVESIARIKLATLRELWTDPAANYPGPNVPITWEVWLNQATDGGIHPEQILRDAAASLGYVVTSNALHFVDRTVILVRGTREQLSLGADVLGVIAEVRRAKVAADFFLGLRVQEQHNWIDSLLGRLTPPAAGAPVIGLLDTGLNHAHPLLQPIVDAERDLHTYKPVWGVNDTGPHGTWMAGLALYGDLAPLLETQGQVVLGHGVESLKLIHQPDPHNPDLYGAVTTESINRLEAGVQRPRVYCMAITADDSDRGRPSSWSAAVDALAAGAADDIRRLIIIAAGNTDPGTRHLYPDYNETASIQDPAQSWNALTVGGYTDKAHIDQQTNPGWAPLATPGDLAPASTTSVVWPRTSKPPFKPDIVMEAGNMGRAEDAGAPSDLPELQLLTTSEEFAVGQPPFTVMGETSGATALAANLAARVIARYPTFTPETLRALLVHSSRWTPAMRARARDAAGNLDAIRLLSTFGYGTPDPTELFTSANNSLTLIAQGQIQPFLKEDSTVKNNQIKHHALPWPADVLRELTLGTEVELRVTLSYFVEPSPGERGWDKKYGYASHGLRFQVIRAAETVAEFEQRINAYDRDDDHDAADHIGETGRWTLGTRPPTRGSIHSNIWRGTAQDLANRSRIAVHPTMGWWRTRPKEERFNRTAHYSLIASISTPDQATDIYTPVANLIGVPVETIV